MAGLGTARSDLLSGAVILGIETSCDETAAALVTAEGEIVANVVASQADLHARFGGVVPEVASRRHLELVVPVVSETLVGSRRFTHRRRNRRSDDASGTDRGTARRRRGRQVDRLVASASAGARRSPARPRRLALPESRSTCSRRSSACWRAVATRCCSTSPTAPAIACSGRRSTTPPGRHSTRVHGCSGSGIQAVPALDALAKQGDPGVFDFPVARVPGLDFSFSG